MKHPDYPGVSSFTDAYGKTRYRFRKTGLKAVAIAGEPHTPEFDVAYRAAIEGRVKAAVVRMPGAAAPESFDAAWRRLKDSRKWKGLDRKSAVNYARVIEAFLDTKDGGLRIGAGPVRDFKRRHVNEMLDRHQDTPGKARLMLICLRKLIDIALDQEWIEHDPTQRIAYNPVSDGHQAWPPHICARFESHWPIGSRPRTAYALALWTGNRRSDVALLRWDHLVTKIIDGVEVEGFEFVAFKGRNRRGAVKQFGPMTPMLAAALAPLDRSTETVLAKSTGEPYKIETLTNLMRDWTQAAGIEPGYTMHGLRKTLGGLLADAEATTHESRDVLRHRTLSEVDRYAQSRLRDRMAVAGMRKVTRLKLG
jgi:integrase